MNDTTRTPVGHRFWQFFTACLFTLVASLLSVTAGHAQAVDWLINTDADPISVPAGGLVEYTIEIQNNGTSAAPANAIYFTVPADVRFVAFTPGDPDNASALDITNCRIVGSGFGAGGAGAPFNSGDRVVCDVPALASGFPNPASPAAVVFTATSNTVGTILTDVFVANVTNTGTILEVGDPAPGGQTLLDEQTLNNEAQLQTTVTAGADLELTIIAPLTVAAGATFDFSIQIENFGPNTASDGYIIEIPVPAGLTNLVLPPECSESGGLITCTVTDPLTVADGAVTFDFSGQAAVGSDSDVRINASIRGGPNGPGDPASDNNADEVLIGVTPGVDLFIGIDSDADGDVLRGDEVVFTISPGYTGDAPADVTVRHEIPANYTLDDINDIVAPGWTVTQVGNELIFTLDTPPTGPGNNTALPEISIPLTATTNGPNIDSTATIETAGAPAEDPGDLGNNSATVQTTIVEPTVDFDAEKDGPSPALAVVGQPYDFTLDAVNLGTSPFVGVVQIEDTIPATLQLNSVTAPGWTCTITQGGSTTTLPAGLPALDPVNPMSLICTREYLAGDPLELDDDLPTITTNTTPTEELTVRNTMEVTTLSGPILDLVGPNNTDDFDLTVGEPGNSADISVIKTVIEATRIAGEVQTYELEAVNSSPDGVSSLDVDLTDLFGNLINGNVGPDEGFVSVLAPPADAVANFSCTQSAAGATSRSLLCETPSLAPCISRDAPSNPLALPACPIITVEVRHGGDLESIPNTASIISPTTPDPTVGAANSSSTSFTQIREVDLTIAKSVDASMVPAGQDVTFTIAAQVVDDGRSNARDVIVTDTLPDGMRFIGFSVAAPASCSISPAPFEIIVAGVNDILQCEMGTINNGSQRTVSVTLQPTNAQIGGGALVNSAEISMGPGGVQEDDVAPNVATAQTMVIDPVTDLIVTKGDGPDPIFVNGTTTYSILVVNNGPSTSEDIVVTDMLPDEFIAFTSVTIDAPGTCPTIPAVGSFGETLICNFPVLAVGESFTIEVVGTATERGTARNDVEISSFEIANGFDTNAGNNAAFETTTINSITDISMTSKVPSQAIVNLEEDFTFDITIAVGSGLGITEAEDVLVEDTLPTNMVLTGTPTTAFPGATCTGVAGSTSFECDLGTVPTDTSVVITVPVEILAYETDPITGLPLPEPQGFTNTAVVSTSTFDISSGNDTASGSVDVVSSTIAGTIFRDFNDDGLQNGSDTPIEGVEVVLTGVSDDGQIITQTVLTDEFGDYIFTGLPGGTYTITRTDPGEPNLGDGTDTPGTIGGISDGVLSGPDAITSITLPDDSDGIDYDFAFIPQPVIGIAKQLIGQVQNADASVTATYQLTLENFSSEAMDNIFVTDQLAGAVPMFGTFVTLANPATDPMANDTYTIVTPPSNGCGAGTANTGYDGDGDTTVASGVSLAVDGVCTITFTIRLEPSDPLPATGPSGGMYDNQATVTGDGAESDITVSDLSDDGADPDASGNGDPTEAGENDPTPLNIGVNPSITLIKTVDLSLVSSPPAFDDLVTFNFVIQNTGNVTLFDVTVVEQLIGATVSGTIASLSPGATDSTTITATYRLQDVDLDAGMLTNQAEVTAQAPVNGPVTDLSGTTAGDDDPLVVMFDQQPGIVLIKTADTTALSDPPQVGDVITYAFEIRNTGNVTLTDVDITDTLPGIVLSGGPITLGPAGSPTAINTDAFTATYTLTPADMTAGEVINEATVSGTDPLDVVFQDDSTVTVPIPQVPGIELLKVITDQLDLEDGPDVGDILTYGFTVTNTGNVPLENVTINDLLPGVVVSGSPIPLMNPAAVGDGTNVNTTVTATYALTAADVANGGVVENTAEVTGQYGPGLLLTIGATSTATARPPDPSGGLVLTKVTPDATVRRGTLVPYTIRLVNENPFPAFNQTIVDTLPTGLIFVADSAQVNGVAVTPSVAGQVITFAPVDLDAGEEVVVTLLARILNGTNPGTYVNEAIVLDPIYGLTAGPATAEIRVLPEPIFDCGDVIGRVFDDLDGDGYQDAYDPNEIPEDPVEDHKVDEITQELTQEAGLPGVRLVTLDGLVITTDENGLFSIPCAALPADRGSNFLVSLDERTLPLGYEMTTMNPRVLRLTPGVLTEMNFGARLAEMMRVDLNASVITHGSVLSPQLQAGIAQMVHILAEDRSRIELVFHVHEHADAAAVANGRNIMDIVQAEIIRQWSDIGTGRLRIQQTIARGGN